jgi:hypothetical protein
MSNPLETENLSKWIAEIEREFDADVYPRPNDDNLRNFMALLNEPHVPGRLLADELAKLRKSVRAVMGSKNHGSRSSRIFEETCTFVRHLMTAHHNDTKTGPY